MTDSDVEVLCRVDGDPTWVDAEELAAHIWYLNEKAREEVDEWFEGGDSP